MRKKTDKKDNKQDNKRDNEKKPDNKKYPRPKRHSNGRWKKGSSGNPKGAPKRGESIIEIIKEIGRTQVEVRLDGKKKKMPYIEALVLKAFSMAVSRGDVAAMKFLAGYRDGLPIQKLEHGGRDGQPIEIVFPKGFKGV